MIKALLVSPRLPSTDSRYGGDNAYTDTLLRYPPPGVQYYHYEDLIASGQMRRLAWPYRVGPRLVRWGILPPDLWAEYLVSDFVPDLLHIIGFSAAVRFPRSATVVPLVLGTSTGSYSDLRYYLGWDMKRIRRMRQVKRFYLQVINANDTSLRPERASKVLVWSRFARQLHLDEGYVRPEQIDVLPPGLPWLGGGRHGLPQEARELTFLFVGGNFERKNGDLVLSAFRKLRSTNPRCRLIMVGRPRNERQILDPGVEHHLFLPREELLRAVFPRADVLVLPSKAEGFGLVLLEAMSFGLPVVAVRSWAMPEIVREGINGLLVEPDSESELFLAMQRCVEDPDLVDRMGLGARQVFGETFAIERHNERLRQVYEAVLNG